MSVWMIFDLCTKEMAKDGCWMYICDMNKSTKQVHISEIVPGDTVIHNGEEHSVNRNHIKIGSFMGRTLFGDSYALGNKLVTKVIFHSAIKKEIK